MGVVGEAAGRILGPEDGSFVSDFPQIPKMEQLGGGRRRSRGGAGDMEPGKRRGLWKAQFTHTIQNLTWPTSMGFKGMTLLYTSQGSGLEHEPGFT